MQRITQRMSQENTQGTVSDRLGLMDLLDISDILLRSETFRFRVASWSMYPALQKGDRITVEPASPVQLQVGDVILFHHCGRLICHRVVALDAAGPGTRIVTKGDSTTECDAPLQPDQVLGRVVGVRPSWHTTGNLTMRIDHWWTRLIEKVAQGLVCLQGVRTYRRIMRAMIARRLAYDVGIPEGRRWFRYHRIGSRALPELLKGHQRFHLMAKLGRSTVAILHVVPRAEEYWLEALYVRLRYRGLGVASQLLALAATAAAMSGARVLLASVESANKPALDLFTKMGFRKMDALGGNGVSPRRDLPGPTVTVLERALSGCWNPSRGG